MYNIFFSIGKRLKELKEEIDDYFDHIRDHKENRIVIDSEPPKYCEIGDIWIDLEGKPTQWVAFRELAIDCELVRHSLDDISDDKHPNYITITADVIQPVMEYMCGLTIGVTPDGNWYGYFKANYGSLDNDWFMGGFINWIAANTENNEVWFEALGDYVREAKYVDIGFPEIGVTLQFNGLKHDGVVSEEGFYNDFIVSEEVTSYFKENVGKTIPMMVEIKTEF